MRYEGVTKWLARIQIVVAAIGMTWTGILLVFILFNVRHNIGLLTPLFLIMRVISFLTGLSLLEGVKQKSCKHLNVWLIYIAIAILIDMSLIAFYWRWTTREDGTPMKTLKIVEVVYAFFGICVVCLFKQEIKADQRRQSRVTEVSKSDVESVDHFKKSPDMAVTVSEI